MAFSSTVVAATEQHERDADELIDRSELRPERSENVGSGTDSEVASHDVAFDPKETAPENEAASSQKESQQRGKTSNPLDVSPANKETSKPRNPTEGGAEHGAPRDRSAQGWTRKGKEVNQ